MANKKIFIERISKLKKGNIIYDYYVVLHGYGDNRIKVVPPDKGGYKVMDIIFLDVTKVRLCCKFYDEDLGNGCTRQKVCFVLQSKDEEGYIYESSVVVPNAIDCQRLVNYLKLNGVKNCLIINL